MEIIVKFVLLQLLVVYVKMDITMMSQVVLIVQLIAKHVQMILIVIHVKMDIMVQLVLINKMLVNLHQQMVENLNIVHFLAKLANHHKITVHHVLMVYILMKQNTNVTHASKKSLDAEIVLMTHVTHA